MEDAMVTYGNEITDSAPNIVTGPGRHRAEQRREHSRRLADAEIMQDTLDELAPNSHDALMVADWLERLTAKVPEVRGLLPNLDGAEEQILVGLHEIVRCYPEREVLRPNLERLGRTHLCWAAETDYAAATEELVNALHEMVGKYLWTNRREVAWARMAYWVASVLRSGAEPSAEGAQSLPTQGDD